MQSNVVSANNPIFQQVIKNTTPPKFTGRAQDWNLFVQDWERYLRKLSVCVPILTNQMKLELWEGTLDDTSLKFFRMRQREVGDKMSYTEEFAKMNAKFSRDRSIEARRKWEEVVIYNPGKVTSREWRDFEASFISAWQEVEGATSEEARRLLFTKIPGFILRWVMEEEERRSLVNPTVRMNVPKEITSEEEVSTSIIVLIGKKPTKVSRTREGDFDIVLPEFGDTEKMLSFNGKCFKNSSTIVKVSRIEKLLDVEEIFLLVNQKLTLSDRQVLYQHANQHSTFGRGRSRAVSIEPKGGGPKKSSGEGKSSGAFVKESSEQAPKSQAK